MSSRRKTKRKTTITAGRLVISVCYTPPLIYDKPKEKSVKKKFSSLSRQWMNHKASWRQCQFRIAGHFVRGDLYYTKTYDDEHLPKSRGEHDKNVAKFHRQMRDERNKKSDTYKYIYSTHELTSDGGRRLHAHGVINAGINGNDYELIKSFWPYGNVEISKISETELYKHDDFEELAKYLCREKSPDAPPTAVGKRGWSCSRNVTKFIPERDMVDEDMTIEAPVGSFILDKYETHNEYGSFKYLKYLLPEASASRPQCVKKIKKKHGIITRGECITIQQRQRKYNNKKLGEYLMKIITDLECDHTIIALEELTEKLKKVKPTPEMWYDMIKFHVDAAKSAIKKFESQDFNFSTEEVKVMYWAIKENRDYLWDSIGELEEDLSSVEKNELLEHYQGANATLRLWRNVYKDIEDKDGVAFIDLFKNKASIEQKIRWGLEGPK